MSYWDDRDTIAPPDDPLAFWQGIAVAVALSSPFWFLLVIAVRWIGGMR